jgi:hypothetical protein
VEKPLVRRLRGSIGSEPTILTLAVRHAWSAIAVTIVAVVLATDPFCCADGCTDGQHSRVPAASTCGLCHGVTVPDVSAAIDFARVSRVCNEPPMTLPRPLTSRIDHPPRLLD